jgi:hypothetical protein
VTLVAHAFQIIRGAYPPGPPPLSFVINFQTLSRKTQKHRTPEAKDAALSQLCWLVHSKHARIIPVSEVPSPVLDLYASLRGKTLYDVFQRSSPWVRVDTAPFGLGEAHSPIAISLDGEVQSMDGVHDEDGMEDVEDGMEDVEHGTEDSGSGGSRSEGGESDSSSESDSESDSDSDSDSDPDALMEACCEAAMAVHNGVELERARYERDNAVAEVAAMRAERDEALAAVRMACEERDAAVASASRPVVDVTERDSAIAAAFVRQTVLLEYTTRDSMSLEIAEAEEERGRLALMARRPDGGQSLRTVERAVEGMMMRAGAGMSSPALLAYRDTRKRIASWGSHNLRAFAGPIPAGVRAELASHLAAERDALLLGGVDNTTAAAHTAEREILETYLAVAESLDHLSCESAKLDALRGGYMSRKAEAPPSLDTGLWTRAEAVRSRVEAAVESARAPHGARDAFLRLASMTLTTVPTNAYHRALALLEMLPYPPHQEQPGGGGGGEAVPTRDGMTVYTAAYLRGVCTNPSASNVQRALASALIELWPGMVRGTAIAFGCV